MPKTAWVFGFLSDFILVLGIRQRVSALVAERRWTLIIDSNIVSALDPKN
jgi:hypothetical protein